MRSRDSLFIALNILIALLLVRLAPITEKSSVGKHTKVRFAELLGKIDLIAAHPERKTIFWGTSAIEHFLDPHFFDGELHKRGLESESYNFGFSGLIASGFLAFANRMKSEFGDRQAIFRASVVEFSPAAMSRLYFERHRTGIESKMPSFFYNRRAWLSLLAEDAPAAVHIGIDTALGVVEIPEKVYLNALGIHQVYAERLGAGALWDRPEFLEERSWNSEAGGLVNWNLPAAESNFRAAIGELHKPEQWDSINTFYIKIFGVDRGFAMGASAVDEFVQAVKFISTFSRHTYILVVPYAPSLQAPADQYIDYTGMLESLSRETGATILDLRSKRAPDESDQDYADPMHLLRPTLNRYLSLVAKAVADDEKVLK